MNITALKNKYIKLTSQKRAELTDSPFVHHVSITTNYVIPHEDGKLLAKMLPGSENDELNHLNVILSTEGQYEREWFQFKEHELKYFSEQIKIMFDYWKEYAALKKLNGVIFYTSEGKIREELVTVLQSELQAQLEDSNLEYLKRLLKANNLLFIGGKISDEYKSIILNFYEAKETFERVLKRNPLITFESENSTWGLFESRCYFQYCGEEMSISHDREFKKAVLSFHQSKTYGMEDFKVDYSFEELNAFFEDVKLKLRLQNEFNPPKNNFNDVIRQLFYVGVDNNADSLFGELCNALGSWEEVEIECKEIIEEYFYKNKEENCLVLDISGKHDNKEIDIYKLKTKKRFYHFACEKHVDDNKTVRIFHVIPSEEEHPSAIKDIVTNYLVPDYK